MSSINFNIRMEQELKERAFPIIESYGLTPAQAVKLFFNQIADTRTIPLSFDHKRLPNAETQLAMLEALAERDTVTRYDSVENALAAIQKVANE